jgi:hypothetical protein
VITLCTDGSLIITSVFKHRQCTFQDSRVTTFRVFPVPQLHKS